MNIEQPDTKKRKAWVWVPASAGPRPQVFVLHGGASNHEKTSEVTQFIRTANEEGFVTVFPDGLGGLLRGWNAGDCCGTSKDGRKEVDDVAFLDDLAAVVSERTCGSELLAVGFSNGAMMTQRWACEGSSVDALMPVAGPLLTKNCDAANTPIRYYHGTADPKVLVEGGFGDGVQIDFPSVDDTMKSWRELNGCRDDEPEVVVDGDVTCTTWQCDTHTEMCMVDKWPHTWPGGRNRTSGQHDATVDGWNWYKGIADLP